MKKKFLVITLISALILSCSAFIIGMMPEKAMAAEGDGSSAVDPPAAPEITMVGASIRTAAPFGLRFEAEIGSEYDVEGVEFGMYLCPTDFLTNGEFPTDENNKVTNLVEGDTPDSTHFIKKVVIPRNTLIDSENTGKKVVRLALIDIKDCNIDRKFSAMAYIIKDGTETKATPITRSISYVARAATAGPEPELSEGQDGYAFVSGIIADSNDFFITAAGMEAVRDEATKNLTHKVTLTEGAQKDIELYLDDLDERFKDNMMCMIQLSAKAAEEGTTIDGQAVGTDSTEITVKNPDITGNKVTLKACGSGEMCLDDVRAITMKPLGTDGIQLSATGGASGVSSLTTHTDTNTVEYNAGGWQRDNVGFKPGKTIGADEYLVIKFRYYEDMEAEETHYFDSDTYSCEGLWIQGLEGDNEHIRHYFATFDENFLDYTLYWRKDGDTSYEGNDTTIPYGSFHGTKELTTTPGTWYYAVAPVKGNYKRISSCYSYLHIDIAEIYSVKEDIKEKLFVPQNYPKHLIAPGTMRIETRQTVNLDADVVVSSLGMKAGDFSYALAEGSAALVTFDGEGNVTTGETVGECDITISAADQEPVSLHITVIEGPKPFEDEANGITRLSFDDFLYDGVSLKKLPYNRREYSAPDAWRGGQISIGATSNTSLDGKYLVIKFRYFNDMWFDADTYSCEGLWPMGYETGADDSPRAYFAIFDEDYLDYTIYHRDNGTPYGSYHGTKGLTTEPGTWYYAVAPRTGGWNSISSCNPSAHLEIEGFYAVASDKIESGDACLFKKGVYPKSIGVPARIYLAKVNDTYNLDVPANSFSITEDELTYSSNDETVATVSGGVVTAVGAGTCKITVALQDNSISKEVVVDVEDGTNLSLARLYAIGEGTMTDTDEGYKYYDSNGKYWGESEIGIMNVPSDKYIVLKFKYIAQSAANDFYMYKGADQTLTEYTTASSNSFDYAFIFNAETNVDMTKYDTNGAPWDFPKTMAECNWYYWVSPNKGAYAGFTSDKPLKCIISNIYAYTAEERQEILKNADSNNSGIVDLGLDCLSVKGNPGQMGEITDTDEGYKCYYSRGNRYRNSMIGITGAPSDKYIVFKFQYIEMEANTIFYAYTGEGQDCSEYRTGAASKDYDYAFLFEYDEKTNTYKDVTNYNASGVPEGVPKPLTNGNWYYWVSANKGTYEGYTSDQILKCNVSNVYAYTAAAREATFGIEVKEAVPASE